MQVQTYFDFKLCFKEVLKETLKQYKSVEQFIAENYLDEPKELEKANDLFRFITDSKLVKELIEDFEINYNVDLKKLYVIRFNMFKI